MNQEEILRNNLPRKCKCLNERDTHKFVTAK